MVDALEYFFSAEATLARLGRRQAQTHAGPLAMEHVDAEANGVTPAVHLWFRQGEDKFDEARPVSTSASPLPNAAKRVLSDIKLPFVIRGYELRSFVEERTPEDRYKEIATWFALDPLLTIQQNLRALRRQIKQRAESRTEEEERLRDLKKATKNGVATWEEAEVCSWFNANDLAHLDKNLALAALSEGDSGYQELLKRKAAEDERLGLSILKQLTTHIEALFKASKEEAEEPAGNIVAFENAISNHTAAVAGEGKERSRASQAVFNDVWASAKKIFEDCEIDLKTCPVCDTALESSPHGSREKILVRLEAKLDDLAAYRAAEGRLREAGKALEGALRDLTAGLETGVPPVSWTVMGLRTLAAAGCSFRS